MIDDLTSAKEKNKKINQINGNKDSIDSSSSGKNILKEFSDQKSRKNVHSNDHENKSIFNLI